MIELSPPLHLDIALVVTFSAYCYDIFLSSQLFLGSITLFPIFPFHLEIPASGGCFGTLSLSLRSAQIIV